MRKSKHAAWNDVVCVCVCECAVRVCAWAVSLCLPLVCLFAQVDVKKVEVLSWAPSL